MLIERDFELGGILPQCIHDGFGSIVFKEFPGGAVELAKNLLRPGLTFCEVEFLEPGKDAGTPC